MLHSWSLDHFGHHLQQVERIPTVQYLFREGRKEEGKEKEEGRPDAREEGRKTTVPAATRKTS